MSTISYDPNETYLPAAGVPRKLRRTSAGSQAGNILGSQLLSQSGRHEDHYAFGGYDVSDDDLIDAAQSGDQRAFAELCRRHSSIVKHKILRIVRNKEDAEDALQDTLLRAYTHLTSFRRSCKFSSWLTVIGVNSALMMIRKRRGRIESFANASSLDERTLEL